MFVCPAPLGVGALDEPCLRSRCSQEGLTCEVQRHRGEAPGPQIALNLFHEPARIDGARQRKHAGLLDYWVLEGDDTPAEQWGPIVQYSVRMIRKQIDPRVRIRAVTDTGGKSLHVLLDEPRFVKRETSVKDPWSLYFLADQEEADWAWRVRQVMAHLVGLGCDRAMLCGRALTRQWLATSRIPYSMVTTRLPGWLRDHDEEGRGKTGTAWQRLLYLLPKYESPYPQA
jgi:hypothetical protein